MDVKKVLFVCTFKGARSRIAAEFVNQKSGGQVIAESSCFESGKISPLPIGVMREVGIDLPDQAPKSVFDLYDEAVFFDYVVSLCHEATSEQCPIFNTSVDALYAKKAERLSWSIQDFKSLTGSDDEKKVKAREIRDEIEREVITFLKQLGIEI